MSNETAESTCNGLGKLDADSVFVPMSRAHFTSGDSNENLFALFVSKRAALF